MCDLLDFWIREIRNKKQAIENYILTWIKKQFFFKTDHHHFHSSDLLCKVKRTLPFQCSFQNYFVREKGKTITEILLATFKICISRIKMF